MSQVVLPPSDWLLCRIAAGGGRGVDFNVKVIKIRMIRLGNA